ncbi:MAG: BrnA antitoxin family protein [Magnetococcales bacterium]|nr:BrnA antitoxin family protein [Magnetococcales bacterium]
MNEKSSDSRTNWSTVDAHVIQPEEYDELPEWTDEMFASADLYENGQLIRRGRSSDSNTKISATVQFDSDVLSAFHAFGNNWQAQMNLALRDWLKSHASS